MMFGNDRRVRTYLDDVPEGVKEQLSRAWGERKRETYAVAEKYGIRIDEGESFNRVVTFELDPGYYHLVSDIVSAKDVSPEHSNIGALCARLMNRIVAIEREIGCIPLFASNVCDWDSGYAKEVGANAHLRDSIIKTCIENNIVLTGGETANLGDQVRKTGMSWMFTLLSRYGGSLTNPTRQDDSSMDSLLYGTFDCIADRRNYEIIYENGMPLIHVKKKSRFLMTADGTGSKSIVCERVSKGSDINCTLASAADDATRDGAFPVVASVGIHTENSKGRNQFVDCMLKAGRDHLIPLIGSVFHESEDVNTYIMNGVVLSEVRTRASHIGKKIEPGLDTVLLYEEQRTNGVTLQRRIHSEVFGKEWYNITTSDAFKLLNEKLGRRHSGLALSGRKRTLGELVAQPSTPYFRIDSMMPEELLDKIKFRINVSSGGLIGKSRRLFEPFGIGASYSDVFEAPELILLLQMASQVEGSKGIVPDKVAYFTWGCGNGAVIGTTDADSVIEYYSANGIRAKVGGVITTQPQINITSRCLDSTLQNRPYIVTHKYTEEPLG